MSVSLHLKASLKAVQTCLTPWLLPDLSIILVPRQNWVSVYAEQLSEDLNDIQELAVPLSSLNEVLVVIGNQVFCFTQNKLKTPEAPTELPAEALSEFVASARAELLPNGAIVLQREDEKPGLAEFFGRSSDE